MTLKELDQLFDLLKAAQATQSGAAMTPYSLFVAQILEESDIQFCLQAIALASDRIRDISQTPKQATSEGNRDLVIGEMPLEELTRISQERVTAFKDAEISEEEAKEQLETFEYLRQKFGWE